MTQLQLLQYRGPAGAGGPCRQGSLWLDFGGMIGNTLVGVTKKELPKMKRHSLQVPTYPL